MDLLLQCLGRQPKPPGTKSISPNTDAAAADFITTLYTADKDGDELRHSLHNIISANSWSSNFAQAVFTALQKALETAKPMNEGLKRVYDRVVLVVDGIEGFVKEHPILCAVIALGILVVVAPWVIEALGFVEGGILEG